MVSRLMMWERAVKKRREAIQRALRKISRLRPGPTKRKCMMDLYDMMYYGIMDRHRRHWHKINGVWYRDTVKARRLRLTR